LILKIEVAKKRSTQGNNKRSASVQGNRGGAKMGKNSPCYNVAAFGRNYGEQFPMVHSTDLSPGEDDRVAGIETTLSSSFGSQDQRIRVIGYFI